MRIEPGSKQNATVASRKLHTDIPDWSVAVAGSEAKVNISYDYGNFVTGRKSRLWLISQKQHCVRMVAR